MSRQKQYPARARAIVPVVGASIPVARLISVVFPAPFGPTRPTTCPAGMDSVHPASAHLVRYRRQRPAAQRPGHERPDPRPGRHQTLVLQLPVGLEHRVACQTIT